MIDPLRVTLVGQNRVNKEIHQQILKSIKFEPIITRQLIWEDLVEGFQRIENEGQVVSTVMCNPGVLNDIRFCCSGIDLYSERKIPDVSEFELLNDGVFGWVSMLMTAAVRVCSEIDLNRIWIVSGIPFDTNLESLTAEETDMVKKLFGNIEFMEQSSDNVMCSTQIIITH